MTYHQGMEELIKQAFLHVEIIGPHVAEGHYDLVGPSGEIILPQLWERMIEPDWTITMHMWPMPPPPFPTNPAPAASSSILAAEGPSQVAIADSQRFLNKHIRLPPVSPWTAGRPRQAKSGKKASM